MTCSIDSRRPVRKRRAEKDVATLVTAAAGGDQQGWDGLVEEFGAMIWAVARAHRLDDADASDVFQATWLQLLEHLHDLHDPACVGSWLATTARRKCLRVLRGASRVVPCAEIMPEVPSHEPDSDHQLVLRERNRALWQAFARLRPSDQALLRILMAEPRLSYEEVSAALDMPIGSIGPTRARALARLRHELALADDLELMVA